MLYKVLLALFIMSLNACATEKIIVKNCHRLDANVYECEVVQ